LLGFIVSNRGIEANPMKILAITDMGAPATIKDVQKLTRRRWTLMYKKCASWKTSFLVWRFIMWYGSIMLVQIYYPSRSLCPGVKAAIHQVLISDNHQCGSSTT
jgi:hypothetical protein